MRPSWILAVCLVTSGLIVSCGVDTSDPLPVARAYLKAVGRKNYQAAIEYVASAHREDHILTLELTPPKVPSPLKLTILENDGKRADVRIEGTKVTLTLRFKGGQWWVYR